jgi:tetratricopeptide (TPR) repeat protein
LAVDPTAPSANFDQALRAYRAGDKVGARLRVDALLAREPKDAQARFLLARLCLEGGDAAAAAKHLKQVTAQQPKLADAWLMLAMIETRAGDHAGAARTLGAAQAANPNHLGILTNLGASLGEIGRHEEGREILRTALRLDPRAAATHFNLGRLLKEMGDAEGALAHYRQAIGLKPDFVQAQHNLGNLLLDLDRAGEAIDAFRTEARLRLDPKAPAEREPRLSRKTSAGKLRHDIEQLRYLRGEGLLDASYDATIAEYEATLVALPAPKPGETMVDIPRDRLPKLAPTYNRLIHWDAGDAIDGPALNPGLDLAAIERMYRDQAPGIAWFDGMLTPRALTALRRFCLASTIWNEFRYSNGYLGAFLDRGFACPLLLQIARELCTALPGIFAGHPIAKMWAFKYDSRLSGIPIHADFAAVNVNFWVTPDEANLNPDGGGLGVWDQEAPLDWDFAAYNKNEPAIRQFLKDSGARMINVPHRQNRAVMFNSDLFHETGTLNFKDGYKNRRINVTMLFGRRVNG